jgi:hypothetical protein
MVVIICMGCATVPNDGQDAKTMRFTNLDNYRYCEVFLIGGNGLTKDLNAGVYNTTALNTPADSRNSCPDEMWAKVDPEKLKNQYDVLSVFKNGPRYWMYDWIELPVGTQRDFNGLQARWYAHVELPKNINVHEKGGSAYKPTTVARKSLQGYAKGQTIFILDDPDGVPWVLQAYSLIVDPGLTYADLKALDKKLKLPPGWKYRVKVLEEDPTIHAVNGIARIVQDNLEGTYNACFAEGNQKSCSFNP